MAVPAIFMFPNETAGGTLAAAPGGAATSWVLSTGHGARFSDLLPGQFYVRCVDDVRLCTNVVGDTLTVSATAIDGFTAVAHSIGDDVVAVWTREAMEAWCSDYAPQPRHFGLCAWAYPIGELGSSANHVPTAQRETMSMLRLPVTPGALAKVYWHHRQVAAPSGSANVYLSVRDESGAVVADTGNIAGSLPTGVGLASATLSLKAGHDWDELVGGPGRFCKVGLYAGTVGNLQVGRRAFADASSTQNGALVAGTNALAHDIQSAADAAGPTATINLLTQVGAQNEAVWFGLSKA